MKNLLIISYLLVAISLQSQTYLNESSIWKERNGSGGGGNPYFTINDYTIELDGDTLINGKLYYKPLMVGIKTERNWVEDTIVEITPIYKYLSPLREENKMYYMYKQSINNEVLLHNFNLAIGDTAVYDCDNPQVVMSIDTVYIGNVARKQFHFSPTESETSTLIEGVGSSNGLFVRPCSGYIIIEGFEELQCYSQNNEFLHIDSTANCSSPVLSTNEFNLLNFTISPNPFQSGFEIQFPDLPTHGIDISVVNLLGAKVYHNYLDSPGSREQIYIGDVDPGVYVILLRENNSVLAYKIIKI